MGLPAETSGGPAGGGGLRAAAYVRMSTDHQRYSLENQRASIEAFAEAAGFEIVQTYEDPGRSGLTLAQRPGLSSLLQDVLAGSHRFSALMVLDVSRWGRFQDIDESAHYEFLLRRSGVQVIYCGEPFDNDGSPYAAIVKSIKRVMAGEYSRDLSVKVSLGQRHLATLGYRQGSPVGYALRRMLVDQDGREKGLLRPREHKGLVTDRVLVVPGPEREQRQVRRIFREFVEERAGESAITRRLNRAGIRREDGRRFSRLMVHNLLLNENYIGEAVFSKTAVPLRGRRVHRPESEWVRATGLFPPIVDPDLFRRAGEIIGDRWQGASDEEMLEAVRAVLKREGRLTSRILDAAPDAPSADTVTRRFKGLRTAYRRAGYTAGEPPARLETRARCAWVRDATRRAARDALAARCNVQEVDGVFHLPGGQRLGYQFVRRSHTPNGYCRWRFLNPHPRPHALLVARMDVSNAEVMDYYVLPRRKVGGDYTNLRIENPALERFRHAELEAAIDAALGLQAGPPPLLGCA